MPFKTAYKSGFMKLYVTGGNFEIVSLIIMRDVILQVGIMKVYGFIQTFWLMSIEVVMILYLELLGRCFRYVHAYISTFLVFIIHCCHPLIVF